MYWHAQTKLEGEGVVLHPAVPVYLDAHAQQQQRVPPPQPAARTLELTCLGKVRLPPQYLQDTCS